MRQRQRPPVTSDEVAEDQSIADLGVTASPIRPWLLSHREYPLGLPNLLLLGTSRGGEQCSCHLVTIPTSPVDGKVKDFHTLMEGSALIMLIT